MNEKIKELFSQAISDVDGIQNPDTQNMYIPDCFAERFAELIILECSELCYTSHLKDSDAHAMNILDHFNIDGAKHWK
jgi:hypothetical protein